MEGYEFVVYKEWRQTGCEFSDGSDTRKSKTEIVVVPKHKEEEYLESCADEYGYQDYSYQFDTKKLVELNYHQILDIAHQVIMALELSDVVNDKEKFKQIFDKLKSCLDYLEKEGEKNDTGKRE